MKNTQPSADITNKVAVAMLIDKNGNLVMQRKDAWAPISPNMLAFFGGHIEEGEDPLNTLLRELDEETSLDIKGLKPEFIFEQVVENKDNKIRPVATFFLYKVVVEDDNFEVYEGAGAETYSLNELVKRNDIGYSINKLVKRVVKEKWL